MLATLPTEVIIRILGYADPQSRIRCRSVNHRLNSIVEDSDELQLQTECEIAGLICSTPRPGNHTVKTQLQAVRAYQKAWRTMNWTQSVQCSDFRSWVDDHTIQIRYPSDVSLLSLYMNSIAPLALDIDRIPSSTREFQRKKWSLDGPGYCADNYAVDPAQDLLVILERVPQRSSVHGMSVPEENKAFGYILHLLSFSTGEPHKLAVSPVILSPNSDWGSETAKPAVELSIGYRHVGILLFWGPYNAANELWVVQWDTAVIKIHASQGPRPPLNTRQDDPSAWQHAISFRFLDSTSLILPLIGSSSGDPAELGVIRIKEDLQEGPLCELVSVTFELPRPRSPYKCHLICASTSRHRPVLPLDPHRSTNGCGLFYHAESSRMLYYHLDIEQAIAQTVTFQLIVSPTVLRHFYELYLRNPRGKYDGETKVRDHKVIIPWRAWEKGARLLCVPTTVPRQLSTSHNRLMTSKVKHKRYAEPAVVVAGDPLTVLPPRREQWRTNVKMVLYDFSSRLALQRDMHVSSSEEANTMVVETEYHLGPETIEDEDSVWDEPIETGLPYRKFVMSLELPDTDVEESAVFNNGLGISRAVDSDSETEWEVFCV